MLVDRTVQPLQLTEAGERFLPLAANLRTSLVAARSICSNESPARQAPVTLAVAEGLESGVLAQLLTRIKGRSVDVTVRVVARGVDAAPVSLHEGEADLWLAPQHVQLPLALDPARFEAVTVAHDRLLPVAAPDPMGRALHTLPGLPGRPAPLLEYRKSDYLAQVAAMLVSAGPMRAYVAHTGAADSLHSLRSMALHGMGVAFLPESMVRDELRRRELVHVDTRWSGELEIRLIRARARPHPPNSATGIVWQCLAPGASMPVPRVVTEHRHPVERTLRAAA